MAEQPHSDAPETARCGVTVLRTIKGYRATKHWRWLPTTQEWSKVSYEAGAWFVPQEHQARNLPELVQLLDQVRRDPCAFVVRGALAPWAREQAAHDPAFRIRRRKHKKGDVEPSLVEVPRRWLMIDIDNWPLPGWGDLVDDPEAAIDTAVHELLPDAFHDAECWWQLSASAGFAFGLLKVHLFFWLAEPAENRHVKTVLEQHAPGVDRAPYNAAQPHFIADPIIEGGHDPLPRRTGWRHGLEAAVRLPALKPVAQRPRPTGMGATRRSIDVADALAFLGHGEGGQGFHDPLRTATLRYARACCRGGERDDDTFKALLRTAIRSAPCRSGGNVEVPYCQDYYLQPMIDGAFAFLAGETEIQSMRPHHAPPAHTVEAARKAVAEHVTGFLQRALAWHRLSEEAQTAQPPEHAALVVGVGVGKSTAAREALTGYIAQATGETRALEERAMLRRAPHRVLWLVPTHKLGNETLEAMSGLGLNVAVMRGRDADEPGTGDHENDIPAQKMCLNLDAVADALHVGADVERSVCGSGKPGEPACPFREACAYQCQKKAAAKADVVIAVHQSLFHRLPKEVSRNLGVVIVDEAWWRAGLHPNVPTHLASFAEEPLTYPVLRREKVGGERSKAFRYAMAEMDTNDLHALSAKAQAAFTATPDGEVVSKETVLAAGLTVEDCDMAVELEWRRKLDGVIHPGMPPGAREKAVERAAGNAAIPRRSGIWKALRELLRGEDTHTGRLQMGTKRNAEGTVSRVILWHARLEVRDDVAELPILCLDATMPVQIVRHFLPRLNVLAEVQAVARHMEVVQITGGWGKTSLVPSDKAAPEENRRRENLVGELADFVRLNSGGNALVVTYEAIKKRFAAPGIRTGHFNAIAGLDAFRGVQSLFVIGRPLPDVRELHVAALALTGRPIPVENGQVETRGALMADGTGAAVNVRAYADPDLEALRVAITESEVLQAIGRGRGVNRDAATPLTAFILADVALPLPVNRLTRWQDVRPDAVARMQARGVILWGPTDAAKVYLDLFPTAEAAKKALQRRGGGGDFGDIPLGLDIPSSLSDLDVRSDAWQAGL